MAVANRGHLDDGDKILLPSSAFEVLARMNVEYPMLFELRNPSKGRVTHCGVLEFTAEEGHCHIPFWMMQNLLVGEGDRIVIKNVALPKATYVKFRPINEEFLDLYNPKVVLETKLRTFSCLTKGDQICISYNDHKYYLEALEVQPTDAVSIIETDCEVDFQVPETSPLAGSKMNEEKEEEGEVENEGKEKKFDPSEIQYSNTQDKEKVNEQTAYVPFGGVGQRLDGKGGDDTEEEEMKGGYDESSQRRSQNGGLKPHQQHWSNSQIGMSLASGEKVDVNGDEVSDGKKESRNGNKSSKKKKKKGYKAGYSSKKFSKTKNMEGFSGRGNKLG